MCHDYDYKSAATRDSSTASGHSTVPKQSLQCLAADNIRVLDSRASASYNGNPAQQQDISLADELVGIQKDHRKYQTTVEGHGTLAHRQEK